MINLTPDGKEHSDRNDDKQGCDGSFHVQILGRRFAAKITVVDLDRKRFSKVRNSFSVPF